MKVDGSKPRSTATPRWDWRGGDERITPAISPALSSHFRLAARLPKRSNLRFRRLGTDTAAICIKTNLAPRVPCACLRCERSSLWRGHVKYEAINFSKKFGLFDEKWRPKVIAEMNEYQFKIVKLQG